MKILVTIGTTQFENLINNILDNIEVLLQYYSHITLQIGSMIAQQIIKNKNIEIFNFASNLDFSQYDIIICHCGTGSILNGLINQKIVIALCNNQLKDNHQIETALVFKDYIFIQTIDSIIEFLILKNYQNRKIFKLKENNEILRNIIDGVCFKKD